MALNGGTKPIKLSLIFEKVDNATNPETYAHRIIFLVLCGCLSGLATKVLELEILQSR